MYKIVESYKDYYLDDKEKNKEICFVVNLRNKKSDIQLLFDFFVVESSNTFLLVLINEIEKDGKWSKINCYCALSRGSNKFYCTDEELDVSFFENKEFKKTDLINFESDNAPDNKSEMISNKIYKIESFFLETGRIFPIIKINKENHNMLAKKIDEGTIEKLYGIINKVEAKRKEKEKEMKEKGKLRGEKKQLKHLEIQEEDYLLFIIARLFEKDMGSKAINEFRKELFYEELVKKYLKGRTILAVLIFALIDYSYRQYGIALYKNIVRKECKKTNVTLSEHDFLIENEIEQDQQMYNSYEVLMEKYPEFDIKTIYNNYEKKEIHPLLFLELTEASSIADGLLQLTDNVVKHAGEKSGEGTGCLSIYLRDVLKNKNIDNFKNIIEESKESDNDKDSDDEFIIEHYKEVYEKVFEEEKKKEIINKNAYCLEIIVCDNGKKSISEKFLDNNVDFFSKHEEFKNKLILDDFFERRTETKDLFKNYYQTSNNAINHYGLPIFNSIITARKGHFEVHSRGEVYINNSLHIDNDETKKTEGFTDGNRYLIFIPLCLRGTKEGRIISENTCAYDFNKVPISFDNICLSNEDTIENYFLEISKAVQTSDKKYVAGCIDFSKIVDVEKPTKGVLEFISENLDNEIIESIYIAIIGCPKYEIVEIVRLFILYLYKQDFREELSKLQIYIIGNEYDEDVVLYGNDIGEVRQNLLRCMFINGIVFEDVASCFDLMN